MIRRAEEDDPKIGEFINKEFTDYALKNEVTLGYDEFCFVEEEDGKILGAITGRAYYNEVHIGDLIVSKDCRRTGLGSKLVKAVEEYYSGKCYDIITLTTFGFQAPDFYKKLGYKIEFVRENKDPKLSKYFLSKAI
jgi:ribosomal protein S18 acetylase RimI-like enzyme